jgi:hypothetical protein
MAVKQHYFCGAHATILSLYLSSPHASPISVGHNKTSKRGDKEKDKRAAHPQQAEVAMLLWNVMP